MTLYCVVTWPIWTISGPAVLFRLLSVDNVISLFAAVLAERRVLLVSYACEQKYAKYLLFSARFFFEDFFSSKIFLQDFFEDFFVSKIFLRLCFSLVSFHIPSTSASTSLPFLSVLALCRPSPCYPFSPILLSFSSSFLLILLSSFALFLALCLSRSSRRSKLEHLTVCAETITYLIYPFFWQHIYIPILPRQLIDYVCAPMPFVMGVETSYLPDELLLEGVVLVDLQARQIPHLCLASSSPLPYSESEDHMPRVAKRIFVIFSFTYFLLYIFLNLFADGFWNRLSRLQANELRVYDQEQVAPLPDAALSRLSKDLRKLVDDPKVPLRADQTVPDAKLKKCFLGFFTRLFKNYQKFLEAPDDAVTEKFQKENFLADLNLRGDPFMTQFLNAQLFQCFVDERFEQSQVGCPRAENPSYFSPRTKNNSWLIFFKSKWGQSALLNLPIIFMLSIGSNSSSNHIRDRNFSVFILYWFRL